MNLPRIDPEKTERDLTRNGWLVRVPGLDQNLFILEVGRVPLYLRFLGAAAAPFCQMT